MGPAWWIGLFVGWLIALIVVLIDIQFLTGICLAFGLLLAFSEIFERNNNFSKKILP